MKQVMLSITAAEWDGIQHRPHHFMRRCARTGWIVLYLEPPATLIAPLKNKEMVHRWKNWLKGLRQAEDNVYVLAPPPVLPFGNKVRWVNKLNQWMITKTVKNVLRQLAAEVKQTEEAKESTQQTKHKLSVDLYSFLPNAVDLLPHFTLNRVIYDCVDDHAAFTGLINADVVHQMEKELMKKADVCFATARQLMEDRKDWSKEFYLIPNGAEYEHFAQVNPLGLDDHAEQSTPSHQPEDLPTPGDIKSIPKPIVGFYGGISDWIDIPLLTNVARKMSHLSFVFIGPVATQVEEIKKLPNVFFLGIKSYKELPNYLQHFDTCLIPFRINKLTESVNPVKLHEYLSSGKPIVSTPLPEVLSYKDVVEIATDEEEMIAAIERTILPQEKTTERISRRQQIGQENSWDARWQYAVSLMKQDKRQLDKQKSDKQNQAQQAGQR